MNVETVLRSVICYYCFNKKTEKKQFVNIVIIVNIVSIIIIIIKAIASNRIIETKLPQKEKM